MKLQQLRYVWEVHRHDLNISATALGLYTSQPGISKQIRLLEEELGVEIFKRSGKHLSKVTPVGKEILAVAGEILLKVEGIKRLSQDHTSPTQGILSIATTHTLAQYTLPSVIKPFATKYPKVDLTVVEGTTKENAELVERGNVNFVLLSEDLELSGNLVIMPCFNYNTHVLVPKDHPLTQLAKVSLEDVASYPLVTHVFDYGFNALDTTTLGKAFKQKSLRPQIALATGNADVIKGYVRAGLGVGIIADLAYSDIEDSDLIVISVPELNESYQTSIAIRSGSYIPGYMYEFIEFFAPHLTRDVVDEVMSLSNPEAQKNYFTDTDIQGYQPSHKYHR
jgi:LysR family transcriptional regulator, cys regulon transcriptional activator